MKGNFWDYLRTDCSCTCISHKWATTLSTQHVFGVDTFLAFPIPFVCLSLCCIPHLSHSISVRSWKVALSLEGTRRKRLKTRLIGLMTFASLSWKKSPDLGFFNGPVPKSRLFRIRLERNSLPFALRTSIRQKREGETGREERSDRRDLLRTHFSPPFFPGSFLLSPDEKVKERKRSRPRDIIINNSSWHYPLPAATEMSFYSLWGCFFFGWDSFHSEKGL